jgi:WD40 repeat protein
MIFLFSSIFLVFSILSCPHAYGSEKKRKTRAIKVVPRQTDDTSKPGNAFDPHVPAVTDFNLVPQVGHSGNVQALAIDQKGKFIVSGSADETIKVWNLKSGTLVRTIQESASVTALTIDPSGRYIISGNYSNGDIKIWSLNAGNLLRVIRRRERVYSLTMDPTGRFIAAGTENGLILVWDFRSGKLIRTINARKTSGVFFQIYAVAIDPTGQFLVSNGRQGEVMVWRFRTGELVRTLSGHSRGVNAVAIDPAGEVVVSGSSDNTIKIWNLENGNLLRTLEGHVVSNYNSVRTVGVDKTGRFIVSGDEQGVIKIWDLESGTILKTIQAHGAGILTIAIDPTAQFIVSGSRDHTIKIRELRTGEILAELVKDYHSIEAVALDPAGQFLVSGGTDKFVKVWNLQTGKLLRNLSGHSAAVSAIAIDPAGKYIVSGSWDKTIRLWKLPSGELIKTLTGHDLGVRALAIDKTGTFIVSASADNTIRVWQLSSGELLHTLKGHASMISSIVIDPSGKYIISASWDKTIRIWDVHTGKPLGTILQGALGGFGESPGHSDAVIALAMDPMGRFFVSSSLDWSVKFWDLETWQLVHTINWNDIAVTLTMDPTGLRLISGSLDGTVKVLDIQSEDIIRTLGKKNARYSIDVGQWAVYSSSGKDNRTAVNGIAVGSDGNLIVSGNQDGTIKVWNIQSDEHFSLVSVGNKWLMFTPDGFFDASNDGGNLVPMVQGLATFGVDQFALRNNRPDLILTRTGLGNERLNAHFYHRYLRRLRKAGFTEEEISGDVHPPRAKILDSKRQGKHLTIKFTLSDGNNALKKYNIFVNDVPLFGSYGKNITGRSVTITEKVELTSGKNKIEVSCLNEKGVESFRALTYANYNKEVKGDLYYIGFGVSKYKNQSFNIRYADNDARDLSYIFAEMKGQYNNIHIKTYLNEEVTSDNIKMAKELLEESGVDDTVVLFIAGHGLHDTDKGATYYYLTYDADLENLAGTAASFELIENIMQGIKPRNKLFLLDTCESGELEDDSDRNAFTLANARGLEPRTTRAIQVVLRQGSKHFFDRDRYIYNDLLRRSGAIVFSSSRGGEFSYEDEKLKNGLFTEAVIDALTTEKADVDGDDIVSTEELRTYVIKSVSSLSADLQHPTVDRDNIYLRFDFPLSSRKERKPEAPEIQGIEIVQTGVVEGTQLGVVEAPTTALGRTLGYSMENLQIIKETNNIPLDRCSKFGLIYVVHGKPRTKQIEISVNVRHPAIIDPKSNRVHYFDEWISSPRIGEPHYDGWRFEYDWEKVSGKWTFEFYYQGAKLAEKTFIVYEE